MKLNECINPLLNYKKSNDHNPDILRLEIDSRNVEPNTLFFCISGLQLDGHKFAAEAAKRGAAAIVAEKPLEVNVPVIYVADSRRALAIISDYYYGQPSHNLHLIGVTGTNGKTSITHIIKAIQDDAGVSTGLVGTMGIRYNDKLVPVNNTTPESFVLQKAFREMANDDVASAVMEVSSHALHQGRVRGCDFNIAVFTNLTQDHLDYHPTMKDYLYAKGLLFSQLGNTYDTNHVKAAVLNQDDAASEEYKHMTSASVFTYGIENQADFRAENIEITSNGTQFDLVTRDGRFPVMMKLIGKFSVYNVLASMLTCFIKGISIDSMIHTVQHIDGIDGRFETVQGGQPFTVIVDYSHTADSLENALLTIKEFAKGRVITVVGCGGDRDRTKRPVMAKTAVKYSDLTVLTSDNPRTEDPERILMDMEAGVRGASYEKIVDRSEAINFAVREAEDHDIILIAGKGHETYQIMGTDKIDFDDRKVAKNAIKERLGS
ncbi:UDP-N-acetylmuramoylalanyl-D-glutamate--2,6-diaminopimelate ligase [Scopulibacillus darangshiensis]|uniref:UDP-N-acetylmuramoyl-L-alanyl-D-glutamate--2,6-diaminopimelate ligase n=1 Tax=Scopulibacillus darangshiensis TaxID=442528 RepID=A0A4R2P3C2_9BACL|nr:UDP-N-acetylmuramoyl-L-alanyl-D-glutamate--2,6-diaminopimelate ligase [Scopulibacillus darangshiensis]TCP29087.1 UDP-N-acetylmuramoylalanyl-D-glutamate--2,6-diaminopimelate ligase [Scopulibacillus darangshiensis]